MVFPGGAGGKEYTCQCKRGGFNFLPWDWCTILKLQLPAPAPSRGPVTLSGICVAVARTVRFSFLLDCRNNNPLQFSCLGNLMYWGASWTAVCGSKESQILLSTYKHTHSWLTIFQVYSKVMWYFHVLHQGYFNIIDCAPCAVYYTVSVRGKCAWVVLSCVCRWSWITSLVISLRTVHRVILHPLEEDVDLVNWHALPQNTDLFCFCKMIVYRASQHLAWNITFTINYIDIYTWSAGDTPFNCLFLHEFHGVSIHVLIQIFIS